MFDPRKPENKSDPKPIEPPANPVAAIMSFLGLRTGKPGTVEHFLYFRTKKAADEATKELTAKVFAAEVSHSKRDWLVLVVREMQLAERKLANVTHQLETLAKKFGGKYDGWGVPFVDSFAVSKPETRRPRN